jgi:hypothetical protein
MSLGALSIAFAVLSVEKFVAKRMNPESVSSQDCNRRLPHYCAV